MCESGISQVCDAMHPAAAAAEGDDVRVTNSIIVVRDPNLEQSGGGEPRSASVEGNYNLSCASSSGISSIRSSDNEAIRRKMCGGGPAIQKIREKQSGGPDGRALN